MRLKASRPPQRERETLSTYYIPKTRKILYQMYDSEKDILKDRCKMRKTALLENGIVLNCAGSPFVWAVVVIIEGAGVGAVGEGGGSRVKRRNGMQQDYGEGHCSTRTTRNCVGLPLRCQK